MNNEFKMVRGELRPCPFCGEEVYAKITLRGSEIRCLGCGVTMTKYKMGGSYKNLDMARRFTFCEIKEKWNSRIEDRTPVRHYGYCEDAHEWKYGELQVMGDYWFIAVQEEHGKEFYEVAPHTVNRI